MSPAEQAALVREAWATTPPPAPRRDTDRDRPARRLQLQRDWADPTPKDKP